MLQYFYGFIAENIACVKNIFSFCQSLYEFHSTDYFINVGMWNGCFIFVNLKYEIKKENLKKILNPLPQKIFPARGRI